MTFFLVASGAWRVASLVANETGPFYIFQRIRTWADILCQKNWLCREFHLYEMLECEWCNSVWIGIAFTQMLLAWGDTFLYWAILPLAISTWVIFLKYLIQGLQDWKPSTEAK